VTSEAIRENMAEHERAQFPNTNNQRAKPRLSGGFVESDRNLYVFNFRNSWPKILRVEAKAAALVSKDARILSARNQRNSHAEI